MNDDIESLLDDLCHCQAQIENGLLALQERYTREKDETVRRLVMGRGESRGAG